MKVIGITGGIGSGKSLVADIMIKKHKAYLIETDKIAKEQMIPGGASYDDVIDYFGNKILNEDGTIDSLKLSVSIFKDDEKRLKLNSLTHPNVLIEVQKEIKDKREVDDLPYCIIETALMIESGYDFVCDEVWYVYSPAQTRRQRLISSRGYTNEKINDIFKSQSDEKDFFKKFSKVVYNDGDIPNLELQIEEMLRS